MLLVYIVPVCNLANAMKQNMSWVEHSSSVGWRRSTSERAWRMASCYLHVDWTPWQCRCMWPLSVAVNGSRWCRIRCGVRPGIVMSSELRARAQRSDGVGGEHNALCIKCAWLPAVEVAAMLAAMAVRGDAMVGGVIGGLLVCRGIIHNPVCMHFLPHRIVWP